MSKAKKPERYEFDPSDVDAAGVHTHPACGMILHTRTRERSGLAAIIRTKHGTQACFPGDFIVPDGDGWDVELADGTKVVPDHG